MRRTPSHAGGLRSWERLAFGLVFALMAAFVVVVTVSAARSGHSTPSVGTGLPASMATAGGTDASRVQQAAADGAGRVAGGARPDRPASLDRKLAAALRAILHADTGHLAVGIIDASTGARAGFAAGVRFRAADVVRADILGALLLRSQQAGARLSDQDGQLAVPMMEGSDAAAAAQLWRAIGAGRGLARANGRLGLAHTGAGPAGDWAGTRTTVTDQLRLLTDLTSARSPLTAVSRDYALGLMENVQPGQQWGVPAAASPGTSFAVRDGWLRDPVRWAVGSVGIVLRGGQRLLIAVLSDGNHSKAAGIAAVSAAAVAAARVVTQAS